MPSSDGGAVAVELVGFMAVALAALFVVSGGMRPPPAGSLIGSHSFLSIANS